MESADLANWLYTSRCRIAGNADREIQRIVEVSRVRNADLAVTGALICTGGFFAQFIEGPPDGIAAIKASILRDSRHADILPVDMAHSAERRFADWTLAYSGDAIEFDQLIAVTRVLRGAAGQDLLFQMIRRFAEQPDDGMPR